ncbi:MAG: hypothetical protein ACREPE_15110, partial [Lysobacter sp.]
MMLKTVRLQLRFLLPLIIAMVVAAYIALPLMDKVTLRWFSRDLSARGLLVANALSDSVADALLSPRPARLQRLLDRTAQDERLFAIGVCDANGRMLQNTEGYPGTLSCETALTAADGSELRLDLAGGTVLVSAHPVTAPLRAPTSVPSLPATPTSSGDSGLPPAVPALPQTEVSTDIEPALVGHLILLHDLSFIDRRSHDT